MPVVGFIVRTVKICLEPHDDPRTLIRPIERLNSALQLAIRKLAYMLSTAMTGAEMSSQDVANQLARAMLHKQLLSENPNATSEDFKAAWQKQKKAYHRQSNRVLRHLDRAGFSFETTQN